MRTNPRQHILEAWRALALVTMDGHDWSWAGGRAPDSITEARHLLCLLRPAAELPGFRLGQPDHLDEDVLAALAPMGSAPYVPRRLLEALEEYLARHSGLDRTPSFTADTHLSCAERGDEVKAEQTEQDLTESFAVSITLCLAAKQFLREYEHSVIRNELRHRIGVVHHDVDRRLTAAMVGLLRSFVVAVLDPDSPEEDRLLNLLGQGRTAGRSLLRNLHQRLEPIRDKLLELTFGLSPESSQELSSYPERFFECGWSWGVARNSEPVEGFLDEVPQPRGCADPRPLLHFTAGALEALNDLFSSSTSRLSLLDSAQVRLREALSVRWELTVRYWSTIATFGDHWPLEDVPWQTTEGHSSPYYSASVLSIVALSRATTGGAEGGSLAFHTRCAGVLTELAQRGLVTRHARTGDPGIMLHVPGVTMPLPGSERLGPALVWVDNRYPTTLAATALRIAGLPAAAPVRPELTALAERIVAHLLARKRDDGDGLWDAPDRVFPGLDRSPTGPDWEFTEDVLRVFVAAAALITTPLAYDLDLAGHVARILAEARHVLAQEQLTTPATGSSQVQRLLHTLELRLDRAQSLLTTRPATAAALADRTLVELDELASAKLDAQRGL